MVWVLAYDGVWWFWEMLFCVLLGSNRVVV
jgi:hypothetical protein